MQDSRIGITDVAGPGIIPNALNLHVVGSLTQVLDEIVNYKDSQTARSVKHVTSAASAIFIKT